jgi:hypothetical protein
MVIFDYLVVKKRQEFKSDDEFTKFVLYYVPWLIWSNACQDLSQLFLVLNRRAVIIEALKRQFGPLLDDEVLKMLLTILFF